MYIHLEKLEADSLKEKGENNYYKSAPLLFVDINFMLASTIITLSTATAAVPTPSNAHHHSHLGSLPLRKPQQVLPPRNILWQLHLQEPMAKQRMQPNVYCKEESSGDDYVPTDVEEEEVSDDNGQQGAWSDNSESKPLLYTL